VKIIGFHFLMVDMGAENFFIGRQAGVCLYWRYVVLYAFSCSVLFRALVGVTGDILRITNTEQGYLFGVRFL
jgi:hypothetical protein